MSLKNYKTDTNLEKDGVWVDYGPNDDLPGKPNMRFRVARAGGSNLQYEKAMEHLTKPYRRLIQSGNLSNAQAKDLQRQAFLTACLRGWEGISMPGSDTPLPFSLENAQKLFQEVPDILTGLISEADGAAIYRETILEDALGNSGQSSNTASSKVL